MTVTEALRDEDVQRVITAELTRVVDSVEVAPLAGKVLRVVIKGGHHSELFNELMAAADGYLERHYTELRDMFESEAPRWIPDIAYRRVFDRLYHRLRERLAAMAADPQDSTRLQFEGWLAGLPDRLETDLALRARGEKLKRDVLGSAALRDWSSRLWQRAKAALRAQAADPDSELRRRLTELLMAGGRRLESDQRLADGLERMIESAPARSPSSTTTSWPAWSPAPSSAGTPARPQVSWSCCWAGTCSSSASTAPWSARSSAWSCTRSAWACPDLTGRVARTRAGHPQRRRPRPAA